MTRETLIEESARAVTACWNYYSDTPLTPSEILEVISSLTAILPQHITTTRHAAFFKQYQDKVASEG